MKRLHYLVIRRLLMKLLLNLMRVKQFNDAIEKLLTIVQDVKSVDVLYSEEELLQFILAFRAIIRLHKKLVIIQNSIGEI